MTEGSVSDALLARGLHTAVLNFEESQIILTAGQNDFSSLAEKASGLQVPTLLTGTRLPSSLELALKTH